jgi:hypothetical protein
VRVFVLIQAYLPRCGSSKVGELYLCTAAAAAVALIFDTLCWRDNQRFYLATFFNWIKNFADQTLWPSWGLCSKTGFRIMVGASSQVQRPPCELESASTFRQKFRTNISDKSFEVYFFKLKRYVWLGRQNLGGSVLLLILLCAHLWERPFDKISNKR